jgi:hypothetical protein
MRLAALPRRTEISLTWFGKEYPPFSQRGQGGFNKRLILPLNSPLGKGDLKLSFPIFYWLENIFVAHDRFATASSYKLISGSQVAWKRFS